MLLVWKHDSRLMERSRCKGILPDLYKVCGAEIFGLDVHQTTDFTWKHTNTAASCTQRHTHSHLSNFLHLSYVFYLVDHHQPLPTVSTSTHTHTPNTHTAASVAYTAKYLMKESEQPPVRSSDEAAVHRTALMGYLWRSRKTANPGPFEVVSILFKKKY